jgi:hypothetical protein
MPRKEKICGVFFSKWSAGGEYLGIFNQCPSGGNVEFFFLVNALQGEYLGFLTNTPQGFREQFWEKTTYDLGSLLKKIISQKKIRIVEPPLPKIHPLGELRALPSKHPPFGRVEGPPFRKFALRAT